MKFAIGAGCILLLLFIAFDPLIALAPAVGLFLGLAFRRLWRYRYVVARRQPLWIGLAVAVMILAVMIPAAFFFAQQELNPSARPSVTITPRYDGTAEYAGGLWKITDRVIFSSDSILKLSDLSAPPIRDEVVRDLEQNLPAEFVVRRSLSGDYVTVSSFKDTSPKLFKEVADYLERFSSAGNWSVSVREPYGEILLTPSLRHTPDQGRSHAADFLITQLRNHGWQLHQVNDALIFSRYRQEKARVRWFPASTGYELQIILPHAITLQNDLEILFAPSEGSRLTLSTQPHLVASTLPTARREEAASREKLSFNLNPLVGEQSKIDLELLSPIFRNEVGIAFSNLSFGGMVKWVVLAAVAVGADEIKRLLLVVARTLQRRLRIPTPKEDAAS